MVRLCGKGRLGDRRNMGDDVLMLAYVIVPFDLGPPRGGGSMAQYYCPELGDGAIFI